MDIPVAFLTREQVSNFLQSDFKRLVQEAGLRGARAYVQQAVTADYGSVLQDVAACLRRARVDAA